MKKFIKEEIKNFNMIPRKKLYLFLGFISLGIFIVFALIEEFSGFYHLDPFLTTSLQNSIPRNFDTPLSFFSIFGSIEFTTFFLIVLTLLIFKKEKLIPYSLGLFALIMIVELIGKFFIYHPAPPKEFFRYALPFTTPHYVGSTFSFPSGHAARTAFLALISLILTYKYVTNKNLRIGIYVFIIFFITGMAISRIYLGEHWTSDVIGGILLGGAFGFLAMVYY